MKNIVVKLDKNQKNNLKNNLKKIREEIIVPLLNDVNLNVGNEDINMMVSEVYKNILLPNIDDVNSENISGKNFLKIKDYIGNKLYEKIDFVSISEKTPFSKKHVENLIETFSQYNEKSLGYSEFDDFSFSGQSKISYLIDLHNNDDNTYNYDSEIIPDINIFNSENVDSVMDLTNEFINHNKEYLKLSYVYNYIVDNKNFLGIPKYSKKKWESMLETFDDAVENFDGSYYFNISKKMIPYIFASEKNLNDFKILLESIGNNGNELILSNGELVEEEAIIGSFNNGGGKFFPIMSTQTLKLLSLVESDLYTYINHNNLMKYVEGYMNAFLYHTYDTDRKIEYSFANDFDKNVQTMLKPVLSVMLLEAFFTSGFTKALNKLLEGKEQNHKSVDLIDLFTIIFNIIQDVPEDKIKNYSRSDIKKIFFKNEFLKELKEINHILYTHILRGVPHLNYFKNTHTGFIIDIDPFEFLKEGDTSFTNYGTNNHFIFSDSESIVEKIIDLNDNNLNRKSEFIKTLLKDSQFFEGNDTNKKVNTNEGIEKELIFTNEIIEGIEKYLGDNEIYEFDDEVYFEYDGMEEFLTMGIGPQASCQNILIDTGYNHCVLSNTVIPYTKLLLGFKKPKGFSGIDFDTKEIIIKNQDNEITKVPLYIDSRNVMVIGDKERSKNGVLLQHTYSNEKISNEENIDTIQKHVQSKYNDISEKLSDFYKIEKEQFGDLWFYEEGNGD